jgi:hypothetical protein
MLHFTTSSSARVQGRRGLLGPLIALWLILILGCTGTGSEEQSTNPTSAPQPAAITLEFIDVQLFHPYSETRYIRTLANDEKVVAESRTSSYGIGLLAEATNNTTELLTPANLRGRLRYHLADGRIVGCDFEGEKSSSKLLYFSETPTKRSSWTDERNYPEESAWRPGEPIRMVSRQNCGPAYLSDVGVEKITIEAKMTGNAAADGPEKSSDTITITLPGEAMTLRRITLDDGSEAHLSGDIVTFDGERGPERIGLAKLMLRVDTVKVPGPLPDTVPPFTGSIDGVDFKVEKIKIVDWVDAELAKGNRKVQVTVELTQRDTDTEAINSFRKLSAELAQLETELTGMAEDDPERSARQREFNTLNRQHGVGFWKEKQRIQTALPCNKLKLVTNKLTRSPKEALTMRDQCNLLAKQKENSITLEYEITRYELPVALNWCVKTAECQDDCVCTLNYHPIASSPLMLMGKR